METKRLRVLLVSKRLPVGAARHAGGQITYHYLMSAGSWADVDLIALVAPHESAANLPPVESAVLGPVRIELADAVSWRGMLVRALGYGRLFFEASRKVMSTEYDLIVIERSALAWIAPLLEALHGPQTSLLVAHDLWGDRLRADLEGAVGVRRGYLTVLRWLGETIETWTQAEMGGIACFDYRTKEIIANNLRSRWKSCPPVVVFPPYYRTWDRKFDKTKHVCFYGNMGRKVNWQSAIWFHAWALPLILSEIPDVVFCVVGASPPPELRQLHDGTGVIVTGFVQDPAET